MSSKFYASLLLVTATFCFASKSHSYEAKGVRGVVRSEIETTFSSSVVARITRLPYGLGDSFKKGDVLVKFDCARYEADLQAAKAEAMARSITLQQNKQLLKFKAGGANDVAIARAKLDQAYAAVTSLKVQLRNCSVVAPFDGRIAEQLVEIYETPEGNKPLLKVVKNGRLQIDLIVPSNWLNWLRRGKNFRFSVDETGSVHRAEIAQIGAVVDPASHTVFIRARLTDDHTRVRPGMSGAASLTPPEAN